MLTLPPPPPAHVMTLAEAVRLASGKSESEPVTLGEVADAITAMRKARRVPPQLRSHILPPWFIGGKTKGRRDASLRSRSNRRKA